MAKGKDSAYCEFTRELGFKIRAMRDHLDLNVSDAGKRFCISDGSIKGYESGSETPNLMYLYKLANACGMNLDDFMLDKKEFVQKLYFG